LDLQKYQEFFNAHDTFSAKNKIRLTGIGEGYAKVELFLEDGGKNYMGTMHGGLIYTMADVAAGTAAVSGGRQVVTLSAGTEYIRPVVSGNVVAEGKVIHAGRTVCRMEVCVHDGAGTLYAKSHIPMFVTGTKIELP